MAKIYEPTQEQLNTWSQWLKEQTEYVRKVAEKYVPWELYLLKSSNHRVTIYSYGETRDSEVLITVNITL